jgi:hypothetical protein
VRKDKILAETLRLCQRQEQLEQQHVALQHGMMTMQDWGHQEVQAYQQLLRQSIQNQEEYHQRNL